MSDVGVTETSIRVGNIVSRGGPLGPNQFTPAFYGANVVLRGPQRPGGVNGRTIEFLTCDDREESGQNRQCAESLVGQDVFAFVANALECTSAAPPSSIRAEPPTSAARRSGTSTSSTRTCSRSTPTCSATIRATARQGGTARSPRAMGPTAGWPTRACRPPRSSTTASRSPRARASTWPGGSVGTVSMSSSSSSTRAPRVRLHRRPNPRRGRASNRQLDRQHRQPEPLHIAGSCWLRGADPHAHRRRMDPSGRSDFSTPCRTHLYSFGWSLPPRPDLQPRGGQVSGGDGSSTAPTCPASNTSGPSRAGSQPSSSSRRWRRWGRTSPAKG